MASVYTHTQKLLDRNIETFTHSKFLHTKSFSHSKLLQKNKLHRETFLHIITTEIAAPKLDLGAKAKTGGTLHRRLQPLYAEKRAVMHFAALQCDLHPTIAEHRGGTD